MCDYVTTAMNYWKKHIGDYLRDAGHLTLLQHGVYHRLLDVYYLGEGPIRFGEADRKIGARTEDEVQACQDVLEEFFEADHLVRCYRHRRCDAEIAAYRRKAEHNRKVGALGGRPAVKPPAAEPAPAAVVEAKPKAEKFDPRKLDLPLGVDRDVWVQWCDDRSARRKPITKQAAQQQLKNLGMHTLAGLDPNAHIRDAIASSWQGLFPPRRTAARPGLSLPPNPTRYDGKL